MRKYVNHEQLKQWANSIAETITVRACLNGGDIKRKALKAEREVLYNIALSALYTLNCEYCRRDEKYYDGAVSAAIDSAEYAALIFLNGKVKGGTIQSYITVYCPLREIVKNWPV